VPVAPVRRPSINLRHFEVDEGVARLVPVDLTRKYNVLRVNKTGATLTLAMADPTNIFAMDEITFMTGYRVEPVVSSEEAIREAIDRLLGSSREMEAEKVMGGHRHLRRDRARVARRKRTTSTPRRSPTPRRRRRFRPSLVTSS